MNTNVKHHNNYVLVSSEGQLVGGEETNLLSASIRELINSGNNKIGIDFEKISYISSVVIGLLIRTNLELAEKGGKLVVYNVNQAINNVLKITRVDNTISIFNDEHTAIKHLDNN